MHSSRLLYTQVLTPLLEHNLKRLLVEKYGLVDSDLEHEIDRNLNYHENLDNILGIHSLADEVTHYEVERELELVERQLERRFCFDGTETKLHQIQSKPVMTNIPRDDKQNGFEKIFDKYFDLFYSESLMASANLIGVDRKIEVERKLEVKVAEKLLEADNSKHRHRGIVGSDRIESFDKLYTLFINKAGNKRKILKEREKAKKLLKKWEKILCLNV